MLAPNFRTRGQFFPAGTPRIKRGHPLAEGLRFYAYDIGNANYIDLAGGTVSALRNSAVGNIATAAGYGTAWAGTGSAYFQQTPDMDQTGQAMSWACGYVQRGNVASFARAFGRTANNGGSFPFLNWDFEFNPSNGGQNKVNCNYASSAGGFATIGTWTGNTQNAFHTVLGVAGPARTAFFADGGLVASGAGATPFLVTNSSGVFISGASAGGLVSPFIGFVPYGAWWNRALTDDEAKMLHWDPTCFLEYPEDEVFSIVVGVSGGGTAIFADFAFAASFRGSVASDRAIAAASSGDIRRDNVIPFASRADLRADRSIPIASATNASADAAIPSAHSADARTDMASPAARRTDLKSDAKIPSAYSGTAQASISGDTTMPVAFGSDVRGDARASVSTAAEAQGDSAIQASRGANIFADTPIAAARGASLIGDAFSAVARLMRTVADWLFPATYDGTPPPNDAAFFFEPRARRRFFEPIAKRRIFEPRDETMERADPLSPDDDEGFAVSFKSILDQVNAISLKLGGAGGVTLTDCAVSVTVTRGADDQAASRLGSKSLASPYCVQRFTQGLDGVDYRIDFKGVFSDGQDATVQVLVPVRAQL